MRQRVRERREEEREGNSGREYDRWVPHFFINKMLTGLPCVRHVDENHRGLSQGG